MSSCVPRLLLCCACAWGLMACAQTVYLPPPGDALPPPNLLADNTPAGKSAPLRIVLHFNRPVSGTDAAWLKALQTQAQVPVQYISAVAPDTHVYALLWPADQDTVSLLKRLAELPGVAQAELDTRNTRH
ncbi:hypothetical protein [Candidatus Aalborgicola defluviihabitans]|uniref:hypothetical protein n=1 Tax=Candidatus Aalborgicola defluviihabitans TaxID=3386187 RepID=UPI001EBB8B9C|nr:hypothetical protein [Burkholderiales bacterium]